MIEMLVLLFVFYAHLVILFSYHSMVETLSASEYASPKWYARRPTDPTHNLCMAAVAGILACLTLLVLICTAPLRHFMPPLLIVVLVLSFIFWATNSIHRFIVWYLDESLREVLRH